jgi:hypothetical protein
MTAGSGVIAARHKHALAETSTSAISKSKLEALLLVLPLAQLLVQHPDRVITHSEMRVLQSGQMNATAPATADGAGLQAIPLSGTHQTQSADASEAINSLVLTEVFKLYIL